MLWLAVLASNIGTWMQTVGAQWLLVGLPNAATLVALVQTADTLPDVLLALPAGALADIFDRRRLLTALQLFQVGVGAALAFTFALGAGSAMALPPRTGAIRWELYRDGATPNASLRNTPFSHGRSISISTTPADRGRRPLNDRWTGCRIRLLKLLTGSPPAPAKGQCVPASFHPRLLSCGVPAAL